VERFEAVVVGAGVMGCATARALARRGHSVAVVEQFEIGHTRGSSHGTSRIFRFSYPQVRYVEMAIEAFDLWHELEAEAGERLLFTTGGLDGGGIDDNAAALASCGIAHDVLTADEAARRWPFMRFREGSELLYQGDGGMLAADRVVASLARLAAGGGTRFFEGAAVTALEPGDLSILVRLPGSGLEAETVVVTAGAWAPRLLGGCGIDLPLRPTRETVAHYPFAPELPPTYVEWGEPAIYALPSPGIGLKVGEHQAGPTIDPDSSPRPDEPSLGRLDAWVRERYPAAGERRQVDTCLYTNAPDDDFVMERRDRIVVGSACSGHGFKFAPLIGERLADLAVS
jgi:sarcosine oxidase